MSIISRHHAPIAVLLAVMGLPAALAQSQPAPPAAIPPAEGAPVEEQGPPPIPDIASIQNPAVRAAYQLPRREPGDYLRAVLNLLDLGQPELAGVVFRELEALNLNDEQRATLIAQFGTASLLRLGRATELGPGAVTFSQATIAAAGAQATSPERITQLVADLAGTPVEQRQAIAALSTSGEPAVLATLKVLTDQQATDEQRRGARSVLVRMVPASIGPLLAAIDAPDPAFRGEVAALLAHIEAFQAAPLLAPSAVLEPESPIGRAYQSLTGQYPTAASAEGLLRRSIDNLRGGVPPFEIGGDGLIDLWLWDSAAATPVKVSVTTGDATILHTARLARALSAVVPERSGYRIEAAGWTIEAGEVLAFANVPGLASVVSLESMSQGEVDQLLAGALGADHAATAVRALAQHAERKDPGCLFTQEGTPSPTARALKANHPRVRYAALETIAAIDPTHPFPGASYVAPSMVRMLTATGAPFALSVSPRLDVATTWGAGLSAEGYRAHVAGTGADAVAVAADMADIELILIDMSIGGPGVREVVFQLRRHFGTALVPIGLLAREEQLSTAVRMEEDHWGLLAYLRPHNDEALLSLTADLQGLLPRDWPTAEARAAGRRQVLQWMNHFLVERRDFYRLRAHADEIARAVPAVDTTPEAWQLVADLGTPMSQLTLVEAASSPVYPLVTRQAAAAEFARSVERFGLLLTTDEILTQYDAYNASAEQPQETQQILGQLLDTIESVRKANQTTRGTP
jgi:CheY-like chemotaxis protein